MTPEGERPSGRAPADCRCIWKPERCFKWQQEKGYCRQHARLLGLFDKPRRPPTPSERLAAKQARESVRLDEERYALPPRERLNVHTVVIEGVEYEAWNY